MLLSKLQSLKETPVGQWPRDAFDTVESGLAAPEASARALAADLAAQVADGLLVSTLLQLLAEDPDASVRIASARALGEVLTVQTDEAPEIDAVGEAPRHEAARALRWTYHDPSSDDELRQAALEASVRAPESWHLGAVRAAYLSLDATWRAAAVRCMAWLEGCDAWIEEALDAADAATRQAAVEASGRHELLHLASRVARLLGREDEEERVRAAAARALPRLSPELAVSALQSVLNSAHGTLAHAAQVALDEAFDLALVDAGRSEAELASMAALDLDDPQKP